MSAATGRDRPEGVVTRLMKQFVVVAAIALAGSQAVAAVDGNTPLTLLLGPTSRRWSTRTAAGW